MNVALLQPTPSFTFTPESSPVHTSLERQVLTHILLTLGREAVSAGNLGPSSLAAIEGGTLLF